MPPQASLCEVSNAGCRGRWAEELILELPVMSLSVVVDPKPPNGMLKPRWAEQEELVAALRLVGEQESFGLGAHVA